MLLGRDLLYIVDVHQIFGCARLAGNIIRMRTSLLRTAERDELLVDDLQVAHVIRSCARSVGIVACVRVGLSTIVRIRV